MDLHKQDVRPADIIDQLIDVLQSTFHRDVSRIYFGDIGQYPPQSFRSQRGENLSIIAINMRYNNPTGDISGYQETRRIGINIIVMVNMIPYFEAMPDEAYGERILVELVTRIHEYLASEEMSTLGGRIAFGRVSDIQFNWASRGSEAVREATILYEAQVNVRRM